MAAPCNLRHSADSGKPRGLAVRSLVLQQGPDYFAEIACPRCDRDADNFFCLTEPGAS